MFCNDCSRRRNRRQVDLDDVADGVINDRWIESPVGPTLRRRPPGRGSCAAGRPPAILCCVGPWLSGGTERTSFYEGCFSQYPPEAAGRYFAEGGSIVARRAPSEHTVSVPILNAGILLRRARDGAIEVRLGHRGRPGRGSTSDRCGPAPGTPCRCAAGGLAATRAGPGQAVEGLSGFLDRLISRAG